MSSENGKAHSGRLSSNKKGDYICLQGVKTKESISKKKKKRESFNAIKYKSLHDGLMLDYPSIGDLTGALPGVKMCTHCALNGVWLLLPRLIENRQCGLPRGLYETCILTALFYHLVPFVIR